jgi:hypothetical protein
MRNELKAVKGVQGTLYTVKVEHGVRSVREVVGTIVGDQAFIRAPYTPRNYQSKTFHAVPASSVFRTRAAALTACALDRGCYVHAGKIESCLVARDSLGHLHVIGPAGQVLSYHRAFATPELAAKSMAARASEQLKSAEKDHARARRELERCEALLKRMQEPSAPRRARRRKR